MNKEKVTLTLDTAHLAELRSMVGPRGLSTVVDDAIAAHLQRLRHMAAVDHWLGEMDDTHGPVPAETLQWASQAIDTWDSSRSPEQQHLAR